MKKLKSARDVINHRGGWKIQMDATIISNLSNLMRCYNLYGRKSCNIVGGLIE